MKNLFVLYLIFIVFPFFAQTDTSNNSVLLKEIPVFFNHAKSFEPITFVNINKVAIDKYNFGQDVPQLLERSISMTATSDAGNGVGYTYMRMRGVDQTRINVTINGVPYNDPESHGVFWVNLPDLMSSADNIHIQRGLGSSNNGAGAFGGTVNIFTNALKPTRFFETSHSYGSYNTIKNNVQFNTGLIANKFVINARLSRIASDGYVDRASSNIYSYYLSAGYIKNKTTLYFNHFFGSEKTYQSWNGLPEDSLNTNRTYNSAGTDFGQKLIPYNNETDNYKQWHYQMLLTQQLSNKIKLNANLFYIRGKGYYEQYKVDHSFSNYGFDSLIYNNTAYYSSDIVRQRWLSNYFYGANVQLNYNNKKNIDVSFSATYNQYRGEHFGKIVASTIPLNLDENYKYYKSMGIKNDASVFGILNYKLKTNTTLYLDIQYRYIQYTIDGLNDDRSPLDKKVNFSFFNPKVGVKHKIKNRHNLQLYAGIGSHEPLRDDFINGKPKAESMLNIEASYIYDNKKQNVGANLYFMGYKNQLVLTGEINDVGAPIRTNVAKSYRAGIELFTHLPINKYVEFNANATLSINKIIEFDNTIVTYDENYTPIDSLLITQKVKNKDISYSPNLITYAEVVIYPAKGLSITINNKYTGRQYMDNTESIDKMIKAYNINNLVVSYKLPVKTNDDYIFSFMLNNFTNRKYVSNGYTYSERYAGDGYITDTYKYNYYYPQAPINFMLGFTMKIR
jgi:iron complex outermembrane receptor protein